MGNADIAQVLEQIADLLEMQGANVFRVRAYRNAARMLAVHPHAVHEMLQRGENLDMLPGVGADLAGKIAEIVRSGTCALLEQLRSELPGGLTQLLTFPGIGPKRVQQLRESLQVHSIDDVLRAAEQGRIRTIHGFGAAMERRIRDGIRARLQPPGRFAIDVANDMAQLLLPRLRSAAGVQQAVAAGSLRRMRDTVGDLDLLVGATQSTPVMDRFVTGPEVLQVTARGPTRASVLLHNGMQVDLRVVAPASFGAAWLYFTGSKAHGIALRRRAHERGLKLNEYGLYRGTELVAAHTEESVYRALGLPWMAPELREDQGEIEAAEANRLPALVMRSSLRGDLHVHLDAAVPANGLRWRRRGGTLARDALDTLMTAARAQGMDYLGITLDVQADATGRPDLRRLEQQLDRIDAFNAGVHAASNGFALLRGLCLAIDEQGALLLPPGGLALWAGRIDFVTAAMHRGLDLPRERQTSRLLRAIERGGFSVLAHPLGRRLVAQGTQADRAPIDVDLPRVMQAARDRGVVLEVNADPLRLDLDDTACRLAREVGVMLSIASDARDASQLARIAWGVGQARRGWIAPESVINTRPLAEVRHLLAAPLGWPEDAPSLARSRAAASVFHAPHERTFHDL